MEKLSPTDYELDAAATTLRASLERLLVRTDQLGRSSILNHRRFLERQGLPVDHVPQRSEEVPVIKGKPREVGAPAPWREQGACFGQAGSWMEVPNAPVERQRVAMAVPIAICQRCDVQAECLDYALEHGMAWGVWGGKLPKERRRLRRP